MPKQYAHLGGQTPMVRWALARARRVVPDSRLLAVVNEAHRAHWEAELRDVPRRHLLVQPRNRGTGAGVLLAAIEVQARAEHDTPIVFLPSDHHVTAEHVLQQAVELALAAAIGGSAGIVLLGMAPGLDDGDYGWILPAEAGRIARIRGFVEKPEASAIPGLIHDGGLVSSFVFAARADALVDLFLDSEPAFSRLFRAHLRPPMGVGGLHELYDGIRTLDMSREVLQRAPHRLWVLRVPPCGWADLGTPARLTSYLGHLSHAA
jgi:mannose-1-phosphate guanylyltransferase